MFHDEQEPPPHQLRILQLLAVALIAGVVIFAAVATAVPASGGAAGLPPAMRYAVIFMIVATLPLAVVLHRALVRGGGGPAASIDPGPADGPDLEALMRRYTTATVVACALLEGAALFGVVVFLIGRDPVDLAIAAVPLLLMTVLFFPTAGRWRGLVRARHS